MLKKIILGFLLLASTSVNAGLIQITGTSAAYGELGWFVVDDTIFATDTSLVASQYFDYSFSDPLSAVVINPGNVPADTGVTHFGFVSGEWTVTGGGSDSLTAANGDAVWIASNNYLRFTGGSNYNDVSWSTTDHNPIPAPGALLLGIIGVGCVSRLRRRRSI